MTKDWTQLEPNRYRKGNFATKTGDTFGLFIFSKGNTQIRAIVSDGNDGQEDIPPELQGWEHVSVSVKYKNAGGKIVDRTPSWEEMHAVKRLFWEPEECVMQLHPPESNYVNTCKTALHLWRPTKLTIPVPPICMV